jgi:hypothetical protein
VTICIYYSKPPSILAYATYTENPQVANTAFSSLDNDYNCVVVSWMELLKSWIVRKRVSRRDRAYAS